MSFSITAQLNVSTIGVVRSSNLPLKLFLALMLGALSVPSFLGSGALAKPAQSPIRSSEQTLDQMFSSEIQATFKACVNQGGVNLAAGADQDGSIICGNGWRKSPMKFTTYVNTLTDFEAAGLLLGFRVGVQSSSDYKPELLVPILDSLEKSGEFRQLVQDNVVDLGLLPKGSTQSVEFMTEQIVQRSRPFLRDSTKFENLLGTSDEYAAITANFCTAPGMSTAQAKKLAPNLASVQMFAICFQEAGIADEAAQKISRPKGTKR